MTNYSRGRQLVFIPSHRHCSTVIDEQLQEAVWLSDHGAETFYVVIDNSADPSVTAANRRFFEARRAPGVNAAFLGPAEQALLVDWIVDNVPAESGSRLKELLLPEGLSYGRGPNLAALIGLALGCNSVHRRDTDQFRDPSRLSRFCVELEAPAGNLLSEVSPAPRGDASFTEARVALVGTSMFGWSPIDRRDLFAAGVEFETRFQQLGRPGVPADKVAEEAHDYLVVEPATRYDDDFYEADSPARVEMGSSAMATFVSELIPEMPSSILGTDYMQRDLAYKLKMPILFHSRKMQHIYDTDRANIADAAAHADYGLRDVQYIQIGRIWQRVDKILEGAFSGGFSREEYCQAWIEASRAATDDLRAVREGAQKVYEDAAAASDGEVSSRLSDVARELRERGSGVDEAVVQAVTDFVDLVSSWGDVVAASINSKARIEALFT